MIQVYTGDGKGKTTAALGLALRAIGAKKKIAIIQFMKKPDTSEYRALEKYKLPIDVFSYGIGFYKILGDKHTEEEHIASNANALLKFDEVVQAGKYDLIVLEEINVALGFKLLKTQDVLKSLKNKNVGKVEVILTGRHAHKKIRELADLVTVMKKEKHYFDKGIEAREGIEY